MNVRTINDEVLYTTGPVVVADLDDMTSLKERSSSNRRKRIRICAHRNVTDPLHEMLIVHEKNTYIRPHKHLNKTESVHLIEGLADFVVFDDEGNIKDVLQLGEYGSTRGFFCRMSEPLYHTLLIHSEFLIFHETTNGPFNRSDTLFAPWSPDETDKPARTAFLRQLQSESQSFLKSRGETTRK
jgi:cupin fold WbuC family metalloprotein